MLFWFMKKSSKKHYLEITLALACAMGSSWSHVTRAEELPSQDIREEFGILTYAELMELSKDDRELYMHGLRNMALDFVDIQTNYPRFGSVYGDTGAGRNRVFVQYLNWLSLLSAEADAKSIKESKETTEMRVTLKKNQEKLATVKRDIAQIISDWRTYSCHEPNLRSPDRCDGLTREKSVLEDEQSSLSRDINSASYTLGPAGVKAAKAGPWKDPVTAQKEAEAVRNHVAVLRGRLEGKLKNTEPKDKGKIQERLAQLDECLKSGNKCPFKGTTDLITGQPAEVAVTDHCGRKANLAKCQALDSVQRELVFSAANTELTKRSGAKPACKRGFTPVQYATGNCSAMNSIPMFAGSSCPKGKVKGGLFEEGKTPDQFVCDPYIYGAVSLGAGKFGPVCASEPGGPSFSATSEKGVACMTAMKFQNATHDSAQRFEFMNHDLPGAEQFYDGYTKEFLKSFCTGKVGQAFCEVCNQSKIASSYLNKAVRASCGSRHHKKGHKSKTHS